MGVAVDRLGDEIARAPRNQPAEIDRVFKLQQAHALRLRASTAAERVTWIKRLKQALLDRSEEIYEACHRDLRKTPAEVDFSEISPVIIEANKAIRDTKRWMRPHKVSPTLAMMGTQGWVRYQPKGVSLIISPWNYPINLTLVPLVSALAAGNTVIVKPSEMSPHCSQFLENILCDVFGEKEVAVFQGAVETSQHLLAKPFDHILFTGSPPVGSIVMGEASKHLASVTLEMGGKSPTIVDKTADLEKAAASVTWGKLCNSGQTCIAPDLIYVHAAVKDRFVQAMKDAIERMYGSIEDIESNPDYGRIVNSRHYQRIKHLLDDAHSRGAKVVVGGLYNNDQNFIAPTLLEDVQPDSEILHEEIFGPLMPIMTFTDARQVIDDVNSRPKALALYVFAKDNSFVDHIITNTSAGGACINTALIHSIHANLPFGGVNNSGIGSVRGHYGFKAFSHEQAVLRDRFWMGSMMQPPYTPFTRRLIQWSMKFV